METRCDNICYDLYDITQEKTEFTKTSAICKVAFCNGCFVTGDRTGLH